MYVAVELAGATLTLECAPNTLSMLKRPTTVILVSSYLSHVYISVKTARLNQSTAFYYIIRSCYLFRKARRIGRNR